MKKQLLITGMAAAALVFAPLPQAHADEVCQYSPKVVAVGPTSCPFALNVAKGMMAGLNNFTAYSPTTGLTYVMSCSIVRHGSVTCTGGDNAEVDIY
jgi:hypothetical protein